MNHEQRVRQYIEHGLKEFKDHKPFIQKLSDSISVLDWRQPDSGFYSLRVVFDNDRGHRVYISGDIGEAVVYPTCDATLDGMATCFTSRKEDGTISVNWGYFTEKVKAASDLVEWDRDDFVEDFKRNCEEKDIELPEDWLDEHMEVWSADIEVDTRNGVKISGTAQSDLEDTDRDYWEWFYDCGKRVALRVILWLVALRLAYEALKEGGAE